MKKNCFACRLHNLFTLTHYSREDLARYTGVTVPVVKLWENDTKKPDIQQFRNIAVFFGLPYEWFLDGTDGIPDLAELSAILGLNEDTVNLLMKLAATSSDTVLKALDDAVYSLADSIETGR